MMISAASSGSSNVAMRVRILVGADRTAEQMSASLALGHIGIHVGERAVCRVEGFAHERGADIFCRQSGDIPHGDFYGLHRLKHGGVELSPVILLPDILPDFRMQGFL
jgi:hypothetical protein